MMLVCIKQHLSNNLSLVYENGKQHWGWVEKKRVAYKKTCSQVTIPSIVGHAYMYVNIICHAWKSKIYAKRKIMQTYRINKFIIKKINWMKIYFFYGRKFS